MNCETCRSELDAYFDGELPAEEAARLAEHLRQCSGCAAEGLARVQQKLAIGAAGRRFVPDPAFRARIEHSIARRKPWSWSRHWIPALATAAIVVVAVALLLVVNRSRRAEERLAGELVDLHVATLASPNPVDVLSSDRHTVKPWFEGKVPFSFNLPELQDSGFALVGGRVTYVNQNPGAELIFHVRKHQVSLFIFQEPAVRHLGEDATRSFLSFNLRSWHQNGLRYILVGDVGSQDLETLQALLKAAR